MTWTILYGFNQCLAKFWAYFGNSFMLLGKFSFLLMAKNWTKNLAIWYNWHRQIHWAMSTINHVTRSFYAWDLLSLLFQVTLALHWVRTRLKKAGHLKFSKNKPVPTIHRSTTNSTAKPSRSWRAARAAQQAANNHNSHNNKYNNNNHSSSNNNN